MKYLRIILLFVYFTLCFIFKSDFENHFTNDISFAASQQTVQQINYHDNCVLLQNNEEITRLQTPKGNSNSLNISKKYLLILNRFIFKNNINNNSKNNFLALNLKNVIYVRAP